MYVTKKHNLIVVAILIVLLLFSVVLFSEDAMAATTGKVNLNIGLNVRSGPGTSYSLITALPNGTVFDIVETTKDSNGETWYKIYVDGTYGYVYYKYVIVTETPEYTTDTDFEKYLTDQGFPESYKPYLRNLHAAHPEWVFKVQKTNLDWQTVIDKQSVVGRNLVLNSSNNSYKSVEYGAYNPATGTYEIFDSGGWVSASRSIIEYYMDPRNSLSESSVFQFVAHSYDGDTQTKKGLQELVANTFLAKDFPEKSETYPTYVDLLMSAGIKSGSSPYVLASMILTEQGTNGQGGSISGTVKGYEGIYNFFNVRAYKSGSIDAVTYGLMYASDKGSYDRPWNTRVKSILGGADFYAVEYIKNKQDTQYLKKFNVMNGASKVATHQYMTNVSAAYTEGSKLRDGYETIIDSPLTFYIPVYNNMPNDPCKKPASGSNDNYLKSLSVAGYEITPGFDCYTYEYEIIVSGAATHIDIKAETYHSKAKISDLDDIPLTGDITRIPVTVTAESGATRTYYITVAKESIPEGELVSDVYDIDEYISGVKLKTSVGDFKSNLNVSEGYTFKVCKADGTEVTEGSVGTGMNVVVYDSNNKVVKTKSVVVRGDNSGDGKCNSLDLLNIQKHIVRLSTLAGVNFDSSDIDGNGKVNSLDLLHVQKHIVGIAVIE